MKKLEGFEQIGFVVNKEHHVAYGMIDGYKYLVNFLSSQKQYSIMLTVHGDNEDILTTYLTSLEQNPIINWSFYRNQSMVIKRKTY